VPYPDELIDSTLTEVKNVGRLRFTCQLQDFHDYGEASDGAFDLVIRVNTRLTGRLAEMERNGEINVRRIRPRG
jgi:hypothetical protein